MSKKVSELNQLCTMEEVDMIRLQLKLQGSVSVKVMEICHFPLQCIYLNLCSFFFFFTVSDLFCQFHISGCFLFSSAVGTCSENIRQWKAFHWCWWALDLCANMTTSVKYSQKKCWDCSKKTIVSLENKMRHTVNHANTLKGGFLGLVLSFPVRKVNVGERCMYSWDSRWNFFKRWVF